MSVDERHQRLLRKLEEVLGPEEARTLMEVLGARGITPEDLRRELGGLEGRLRQELEALESRMNKRLEALAGRMDTKLELIETRVDTKLELLETRVDAKLSDLRSDLLEKMNEQTKTLFRTFVVSNAAMVLAVGTLAFGAARLA